VWRRVVLCAPAFITRVAGVVPSIDVGQEDHSSESRNNFIVSPHWGFHLAAPFSFSFAEFSAGRVI